MLMATSVDVEGLRAATLLLDCWNPFSVRSRLVGEIVDLAVTIELETTGVRGHIVAMSAGVLEGVFKASANEKKSSQRTN